MNRRLALLTASALILSFSSVASAKGFRATKKQQRDVAVVKRKIQRSKLNPAAKAKAIKAIERAQAKLKTSSDPHLRLYTRLNRYESTLVFGTGGGKSLTLYFRGQKGGDVKMFQDFGHSRHIFRARSLSPELTIAYRGRVDNKNNFLTTNAYRLMSKSSARPTFLTERLWNNIYYGQKAGLVPQLESAMLGKPRGLDLSRGKVRLAPKAPRQVLEGNDRGE
jgi:hypothetical protein